MADIPADSSTTTTISVGGSVSSAIDFVGDHDWIAINLVAGQAVDISVTLGTLVDSQLNIRNSSGTIIYSNDDIIPGVNRASEVKFDPSYTGTYYIDVSAWSDPNAPGDGYTGTGTYTVSAKPYTPPPLATNDQIANQLTSGYWGGDVHHWAVTQGGTLTVDIHTLTAAEQNLAVTALQEWTDIIGVNFQQVTSGAQIVFSDAEDTTAKGPVAQTDASWANGTITSAHVQISKSWVTNYGSNTGSYSFQTYVHEIGHALGLGHAGDYNNTATFPYDSLFQNDAWSTSIMSYFSQHDNSYFANQGFSELYALTPMVDDIIAMQSLYGLSTTTRTGDTVYGDNSNAGGVYDAVNYPNVAVTIFDSAGNDTIDYSLSSANQLINLNPETFSNVNGYTGNLEIARGVVIENAISGSGADTLIGNSANNVLTGNGGADTLTGGGGKDTFSDTKFGHNGDTITDFHAGDTIVFSDATLAAFTYDLVGTTLNYAGGSMTVHGVVNGKFTASAAPAGGVQLVETLKAHNDFTGDGLSDILLHNDDGTVTDWVAQPGGGFANNSANFQINASSNWHVAGTGDFNGDGKVDILWRADDGTVTDWLGQSNGSFSNNWANFTINASSNWHVIGTGDFNGDGISDILWRADDGTVTDWLGQSNGSFSSNGANFTINASSNWHVIGTGDFNGDGISDILWRADDGTVTDWLGQSNGSFSSNGANFTIHASSNWHVIGTGDFNGDGTTDILWRADDGTITDWLGQSNGGFAQNWANFHIQATSNWKIVGTGDFNGDAVDDIIWRSDSGQISDWFGQANGALAPTAQNYNTTVDPHWHVQPEVTLI